MTSVDVSDRLPLHFYERAMDGHPVAVQLANGTRLPLRAELWSSARPGDESVLARCQGATLDVGCGAGRMTRALHAAGIRALGIDISAHAVFLSRSRGAAALHQDVFAATPDLGRWQHVLLMDGNIGISGDATALLNRARDLLECGGTVIVEAGPPGTGSRQLLVKLVHRGTPSHPFRWLVCDADAIIAVGTDIGLVPIDTWTAGGRWFVELSAPGRATGSRQGTR